MINEKSAKIKCLLCGRDAQCVEQNCPGYQEPDTFFIYNCTYCNTQFSYPRVDAKHIYEMIYEKAETVPGYDRYYNYKNKVKTVENPLQYLAGTEEAYWVIDNALRQDIGKKDLKILECGCGMGYLTYSLHKAGFNVIGLDISQNAVNEATENFGDLYVCANVFEYAMEHKDEYDRIILTQVIEHIEEPVKWLETLLVMLKQGGKIILSTENKTIYPRKAIWQSDLPPIHVWWFSEKSFEYIANKINASINFTDFSQYISDNQFIGIGKVPYNLHRFDKNGDVIVSPQQKSSKSLLRTIAKKIPFIRYIYYRFWKHYIGLGKRRAVIGVILEKK
ncbi:3-demethylubiquinol 3-O-methyltransferase [Fibrobacteria bacterium R8-3-H12]